MNGSKPNHQPANKMKSSKKKDSTKPSAKFKDLKAKKNPKGGSVKKVLKGWIDI
jgi:hypothetical protein